MRGALLSTCAAERAKLCASGGSAVPQTRRGGKIMTDLRAVTKEGADRGVAEVALARFEG